MTDKENIQAVIQTYFDCMNESSGEKVTHAFHPDARITGYLPTGLQEMSVADFSSFVAAQTPPPQETDTPVIGEILSLEIAGNTAVAKVRDRYLGMSFLDTLSFLKIGDGWSIYNKLFHVES
ncbi:MAG: nuclear transport factor 2 family protein [Gammaproteobacteria bacterium]|nr:nuclear transport factor 2 family protein [Gammaproteobacteria bacterium]